ncbi:UNKNOWN [Stylonychia lemnae]|uniref:ATP adenylyltransferase C-terminal domain-containing protein n=1 Tax=Stylonychia lemnae TaxID=5949 RepID=A0A078ATK4_STYLE|nr:UNKNOWN [Stylonychia lemnae]|eukprot:CDW85326.1 UNKNOWN [Stylonychia lemnae]
MNYYECRKDRVNLEKFLRVNSNYCSHLSMMNSTFQKLMSEKMCSNIKLSTKNQYLHFVFIPFANKYLPQYLNEENQFKEALMIFKFIKNPGEYIIGLNSVGDQINTKPCFEIDDDFQIHLHDKLLFNGVVIRMKGDNNLAKLDDDQQNRLCRIVCKIVNYMNEKNQPYNLIMNTLGIHVIPRQNDNLIDKNILGIAFLELYGALILKSGEIWEQIRQAPQPEQVEALQIINRTSHNEIYEKIDANIFELIREKVGIDDETFTIFLKEIKTILLQYEN